MPMNEKDQPVTQITRFEDTPEYKAFALRMQDMLDTAPTSYVVFKLPGLSDNQMEKIATVMKKLHDEVY